MTVHEYCTVHDQPLGWCKDPQICRGIMRALGVYRETGQEDGEGPEIAGKPGK